MWWYLTSLVRTSASGFTLDDCYTLEQVQTAKDENRLESLILPVERVFNTLPEVRLNEHQTRLYRNGVKLDLSRVNGIKTDFNLYSVYGFDGNFIGTALAEHDNGILRIGKNLV